jgi:uncharacterized RDD family membrane protein YckC
MKRIPFLNIIRHRENHGFLNFLIDNVVIKIALAYITGLVVGYMLMAFFPEFAYSLSNNKAGLYLISVLIVFIDYLLYYTLSEELFNGITIAKLITGTKAINEIGRELSLKETFLRSACGLISFEPLSGLATPWHDSVTNTIVIKTR